MSETLTAISIGFYIAAGVFLVVSVVLWFVFRISEVIGDLSGKNAKKSIEKMRLGNEKAGSRLYRSNMVSSSQINRTKGKKESDSINENAAYLETGLISENQVKDRKSEDTQLLMDDEMTEILSDKNKTQSLAEFQEEKVSKKHGMKLKMIEEVIYIHTDEEII